jgi:predicted transcriptional regulator of viral defense system
MQKTTARLASGRISSATVLAWVVSRGGRTCNADVAERFGLGLNAASQVLSRMVEGGKMRRVSIGVYEVES